MLETKKIVINDNGVDKNFTVTALDARAAMHLLREVMMLLSDTELIHSVVLKAFIHRVTGTGVEVEGAEPTELQELLQQDIPFILTNLIKSIMNGLDDKALDQLINKCLASVIYHNGSQAHPGLEALQLNMIQSFETLMQLMYEVFLMNYTEAIGQIKKLVGLMFAGKMIISDKE
jgi:hypothetical protein